MSGTVLIRPLCEGEEPEFAEPLGIERLGGYLRRHGVEAVTICDRRLAQAERRAGVAGPTFWKELREAAERHGLPDLVGVSLMTAADVPDALRVLSRVHAWWPQARCVAGGLYVTTAPDEAARRLPRGTILLRGEGEAALLALARGVGSMAEAPTEREASDPGVGLMAEAPTEREASDPVRTWEVPLSPDEWAPAARDYVERYAALGCAVNMQTSRGCPGVCTFCATPQLPSGLSRWTPRSIPLVVDEMQEVAERLAACGLPPIFNFVDDDFGPLGRLEELAVELDRRNLSVAFACEMRLRALMSEEQLKERLVALQAHGLTRVFVGVESLNRQTLRSWHKYYDLDKLPSVVEAFHYAGVSLQCGYILWHRDQTPEGALQEVRMLEELGIYTHQMGLSRMIVFRGCERGDSASEQGLERLEPRADALYQSFVAKSAELGGPWLSAAIREPYEAAKAHLTGDYAYLGELHRTLEQTSRASYACFESCADELLSACDERG